MKQRCMILVVDDDPVVLESMELFLSMQGHEVLTAREGSEALVLADAVQPDVILSNFSMTEMDGLTLFRRLREDPTTAHIPFVFFSADSVLTIREKCLSEGADAFVNKNDGIDAMLEAIQEALQARGSV